ncbi:hypothetical protein NC653_024362 [Populus alba x Populus x berolinensis]|uniref:Uncharacterized protein n=1 Tax=Populus alba x Populus x berolinensis TaxID=444605 RepID=A0AAD6M975_9ROSI|nr:hypothetical protein NC653_024362 [Populus alba x Populus x berolinensis]
MNIPGSGERKLVVILTSSAICVLCSTVRFLFLCSSVPISLFGLALFFFFTSFLLYFPLCFSSFHPPSLCLSLPSVLFLFFLPFFTIFRSSPSLDLLSSLHSLPYSPFFFVFCHSPLCFSPLSFPSGLFFFFFFLSFLLPFSSSFSGFYKPKNALRCNIRLGNGM